MMFRVLCVGLRDVFRERRATVDKYARFCWTNGRDYRVHRDYIIARGWWCDFLRSEWNTALDGRWRVLKFREQGCGMCDKREKSRGCVLLISRFHEIHIIAHPKMIEFRADIRDWDSVDGGTSATWVTLENNSDSRTRLGCRIAESNESRDVINATIFD
jgi:hypothetical protein